YTPHLRSVEAVGPDLSQIAGDEQIGKLQVSETGYAAIPSTFSMKRTCPTTSPFASHLTCPFRIMFMASYPAMVRNAPSSERNHRPAATRFLTKRWSCSSTLFK